MNYYDYIKTTKKIPTEYSNKDINKLFYLDNYYSVNLISKKTGIGRNKLYKYLRKINLLDENNYPTDLSISNNLIEMRSNSNKEWIKPYLRYKGIIFLFNFLNTHPKDI